MFKATLIDQFCLIDMRGALCTFHVLFHESDQVSPVRCNELLERYLNCDDESRGQLIFLYRLGYLTRIYGTDVTRIASGQLS